MEDAMECKRTWENKGNGNLKATIPDTDYNRSNTTEKKMEYSNYFGSIIINDV